MCVAHSIAPPAAQFNNVSLCLLVFIPNITGLLRLGIKHEPPTLSTPRVLKFEKYEQLRWARNIHMCRILVGNSTAYMFLSSCTMQCKWRIPLFD